MTYRTKPLSERIQQSRFSATAAELEQLKTLAREAQKSTSDYVRQLIANEWARREAQDRIDST